MILSSLVTNLSLMIAGMALTFVPANTDTIDAGPSFSIQVPFNEPSVWQSWRGNPDKMIPLQVGEKVKLFGTERQKFLYQEGDTWFVYGLFGNTLLSDKPYGDSYTETGGQHNGIDFVVVPDLEVIAAQAGLVVSVSDQFGGTVVLKHWQGYRTTYANIDEISVEPGDVVAPGQLLGMTIGDKDVKDGTGYLHFGLDHLNKNGTVSAVNPLRFLKLDHAVIPITEANTFSDGLKTAHEQTDFIWDALRFFDFEL